MEDTAFLVYHYCIADNFKKIMSSKVLWLSDLTDSNDDQEVERTFVILWEGVKKRLRQTDLPRDILEQTIEVIDNQYKVELIAEPPYGICFSQKEDLLSQWKEYGGNTRGLSLGFDINWFIKNGIKQQMPHPNSIQSNARGCNGVIYHSEDFEEKMANLCYQALLQFGSHAWLTLIRTTFKHYSSFVKNPTFEPEEEIRIVYYPMDDIDFSVKDINISELKTDVRKHYEIPWINEGTQALRSICIGHNCTMSKDDIIEVLKANGIDERIKIIESECSYRIRD